MAQSEMLDDSKLSCSREGRLVKEDRCVSRMLEYPKWRDLSESIFPCHDERLLYCINFRMCIECSEEIFNVE